MEQRIELSNHGLAWRDGRSNSGNSTGCIVLSEYSLPVSLSLNALKFFCLQCSFSCPFRCRRSSPSSGRRWGSSTTSSAINKSADGLTRTAASRRVFRIQFFFSITGFSFFFFHFAEWVFFSLSISVAFSGLPTKKKTSSHDALDTVSLAPLMTVGTGFRFLEFFLCIFLFVFFSLLRFSSQRSGTLSVESESVFTEFYRVYFPSFVCFFTLNQALVNIKIRLNVLFFVFFFSFSFLFFAFHLNGPERCRSSPNLFYRVLPSFTELFSKLSLVFTLSRVFVLVWNWNFVSLFRCIFSTNIIFYLAIFSCT